MTETTAKFNPNFHTEQDPNTEKPWDDDVLQREEFALCLTNIALSTHGGNSSFSVSLHGNWGSGKTFLLKRWRQDWINSSRKAIYFNAWEDDFQTNPLVAIVGQLYKEIKGDKFDEVINQLKKIILAIVEKQIDKPSALSKFCAFIYKLTPIVKNIIYKYSGLDKKDVQSTKQNILDNYLQERKELDKLRECLEKLTQEIKKETNAPLVFIIDELDRCRPTFAIKLLEHIKHVFGVPGIVFVFGINKESLEKSIKSVYGDIDAEDYLSRFFNMNLTLPPVNPSTYCSHLLDRCEVIKNIQQSTVHQIMYQGSAGRPNHGSSWEPAITKVYAIMADRTELSLREVERSIRLLSFVLSAKEMKPKNKLTMSRAEGWVVSFLIFLRIKEFDLYQKFIKDDCAIRDVIDVIMEWFPEDEAIRKMPNGESILEAKDIMESIFYLYPKAEHKEEFKREFDSLFNPVISNPSEYKHISGKTLQRYGKSPKCLWPLKGYLGNGGFLDRNDWQNIVKLLEWGGQ